MHGEIRQMHDIDTCVDHILIDILVMKYGY